MFHFRHKPFKIGKSGLINTITLFQQFASAMLYFLIPLFFFAIFQSELSVGKISSIAAFVGIGTTILLSLFLKYIPRHILYKISAFIFLLGIVVLFWTSTFFEATSARIMYGFGTIIPPAILSLYLRDLSKEDEFEQAQSIHWTCINISWLLGPILAGFLLNLFQNQQNFFIQTLPFLQAFAGDFFGFYICFSITFLLFSTALSIFSYGKIVIKHPHLEENKNSKKSNNIHNHKHLAYFAEFFENKKRTLAFIHRSFLVLWFVFAFIFLPILLEKHGVTPQWNGLIIGLLSLPNATIEIFVGAINKKTGDSFNTLILGHIIFFLILLAAYIVGFGNIYLFAALVIVSQIGVALTEPLQDILYYEGTPQKDEERFYSLAQMGGSITKFISPVIIGIVIAASSIETAFYIMPFLFVPLFGFFAYLKIKDK